MRVRCSGRPSGGLAFSIRSAHTSIAQTPTDQPKSLRQFDSKRARVVESLIHRALACVRSHCKALGSQHRDVGDTEEAEHGFEIGLLMVEGYFMRLPSQRSTSGRDNDDLLASCQTGRTLLRIAGCEQPRSSNEPFYACNDGRIMVSVIDALVSGFEAPAARD